ncbi:MAG: penicillin-binding protein 2 [Patescibacteria group bacterium]
MKKDFFLEEAVLDDLAKGLDLVEMPLSEKIFKIISFAVVIIAAVVFLRVSFLGIWKGDFYKERALANAGQIISLAAERGIIFDRFGKPLVKNNPTYKIDLKFVELMKPGIRKKVFKELHKILGIEIADMEESVELVDLEKQDFITLPTNITKEQAEQIKNLNLKPVIVKEEFKREYFESRIFSHILGYVGAVGDNDIKNNPVLDLNDIVGKSGLEGYYDKELRGIEGQIIYYRNAKGEIIDSKFLAAPSRGLDIKTAIDKDFQIYFYNRLKEKINSIDADAGVGIALNPKTGEVLALVSIPSFDANEITKNDLNNPQMPFLNRAISGVYAPGSTIKPLVALAALKEGIINPKTEIYSRGYIEIPNPYFPDKPSRFVDWKPHGWVDLYSALARSSNVYFYALGGGLPYNEFEIIKGLPRSDAEHLLRGLGISRLREYWKKFGFDEKTGIDLLAETNGFLPDIEKKEKNTGEPWRLGDTYNISIGQGDLLITPLSLLNYIAAIANNGKFYKPTVKEISQPEVLRNYPELADYIKEIQKGMIDTVSKSYGTANLLSGLPFKIAAKTGSAQIQGNTKINASFVGYAPADNPKIAILVLVENAREGSLNAVPVAKDVLEWYYYNRIKN